ncbi:MULTISPECIES: cupin domain-containing protein [unclassified Ruegeria]|uniref:cupin domain-containing protein n=1 Tax=unclassified Ruegeria TaxID=2625375 RepID=UPI0014882D8A|nr:MULTISPECIES: cupin domain-containing protein [unclassified Ruegeria]
MIEYKPDEDVGSLEHWPFDNPESDYVIKSGSPTVFGRMDAGGSGHTMRAGIWRCTPGVFECTEQGDELMTILSGKCQLTDKTTGEVSTLCTGDSLFIRDGSRVEWNVTEEVTKVFFGQKRDGY